MGSQRPSVVCGWKQVSGGLTEREASQSEVEGECCAHQSGQFSVVSCSERPPLRVSGDGALVTASTALVLERGQGWTARDTERACRADRNMFHNCGGTQ